jgi:hypothetical protein
VEVFVARQPIFDRQRQLYGYELLYRSKQASNQFDGTEASLATRSQSSPIAWIICRAEVESSEHANLRSAEPRSPAGAEAVSEATNLSTRSCSSAGVSRRAWLSPVRCSSSESAPSLGYALSIRLPVRGSA